MPTNDLCTWTNVMVDIATVIASLVTAFTLYLSMRSLRHLRVQTEEMQQQTVELRRQTDLANKPYLQVRFRWYDKDGRIRYGHGTSGMTHFSRNRQGLALTGDLSIDLGDIDQQPYYKQRAHQEWQRYILQNLKDKDLTDLDDSFLALQLTNVGKSQIGRIKVRLHLKVQMFQSDQLEHQVPPREYKWDFDEVVDLEEEQSVMVSLTNVKYFPIYRCSVDNIQYTGVRGENLHDFDGPGETGPFQNETLRPALASEENLILMNDEGSK